MSKVQSLKFFWIFFCLLTLSGCLLPSFQVFGQQTQLAFRHYTTDHGLPSSEVYFVLQDRIGYMWFATDNGVSRFNGYEFENFGAQQGLKDNTVFHMQEDSFGRIWMSTLTGNVYYYEKGHIYPYEFNSILRQYKKRFAHIGQFYIDPSGTFYGALIKLGFIVINKDGSHELISEELPCNQVILETNNVILSGYINCIQSESYRAQWQKQIKFNEYLLSIYTTEGKIKKIPFNNPYDIFTKSHISFGLKDGTILHYYNRFLYVIKENVLIKQIPFEQSFNSFLETEKGELYFGLNGQEGVRVYESINDLGSENFRTYLKGYSVLHIYLDLANGLWLTTFEDGVFYAPNQNITLYNQVSGLSSAYITAVSLKNEKEVFFGLRNGDIYLANIDQNLIKLISTDNKEITDLYYDHKYNRLWNSTVNQLRYWEQEKWQELTLMSDDGNNRAVSINIRKLAPNPRSNEIWACQTGSVGFIKIDKYEPSVKRVPGKNNALVQRTHAIIKDKLNRIWVGLNEGLFEVVDDTLREPSMLHYAFGLRVEDFAEMKDSTLVIGTKGGGVMLWKGQDTLQISDIEGLTTSMIEKIHIDAAQNIWVGTLNGLNRITLDENWNYKLETVTMADGLPSNEITDITSWEDHLWVATTRGLTHFSTNPTVNVSSNVPIIEKILVNNQNSRLDSLSDLSYQQNNLAFTYLTFNYKLDGNIEYRYRLNPHDSWTLTRNKTVNLAALSPDTYQFEVQARNEDGFWSNSTIIPFYIRPPFWETWWFWSLLGVCSIGIMYLFYQSRIDRLKKEANLERELYELRQSALRAQMKPHFIFNCLNSIQGFIAQGNNQKATRYLARFAKLIRAVLDTSMQNSVALSDEIQMLENYLTLEKIRFQNSFDFAFKINPEIDTSEIYLPPLLVQPYIENAIIHGLADDQKDGLIQIAYSLVQNHLKISIQDNGIGIYQSQKKKNNSLHKSVGMTITNKRLELLSPKSEIDHLKIEELKGDDGKIQGTRITLLVLIK